MITSRRSFITGLVERFRTSLPPPAWRDMSIAPRDGSEIEIKCTYGREPWVQRAMWLMDSQGPIWKTGGDDQGYTYVEDRWFGIGANNSNLQWRPVHR